MAEVEISFICFFCGFATESADPITLCASWVDEDGDEREQYWKAHRACLIEHASGDIRMFGGPLFGTE